ncbi:MAG: protein translocase subunit SecD, partial [Planctomycetota bacterium]
RLAPGRLSPTTDQYGRPAVGFEFDAIGRRDFARITEKNRGWSLAIILDGVLKSAPVIRTRIYGAGIIEGDFGQDEVLNMVNVLRAGSLPMDIELLQENTVGPQLGRDSIRKGISALAVAGLLVLAFIGFYYLRCGMVADGALIMNLVLLIGVLCLLGAALTLPGMAGILLTVGMAVDANVLIFERIREESAAGKGVRIALRNGYERAFTTIVDANVTTLLTAVILYLIGTGPVRGFAVTLSFGILLSMFTALVVTRLVFETMIEKDWLSEFMMFSLLSQPQIEFSRIRRPAYIASAAVVAVGLVAFFGRGSDLYDIDFTGGSLVQVSLAEPTPVGEVRSLLAEGGFPDAEVQGIQTAAATAEGTTDFGIRIKGTGTDTEAALRLVSDRLAQGGLSEGVGSLSATPDGRALELELTKPLTEAELRSALGEGGGPFSVAGVAAILPLDVKLAGKVVVRPSVVPPMTEERDVRAGILRALGWAGLRREDYRAVESVLRDGQGSAGSEAAQLELALDKPIDAALLEVELARRQFPEVRVAESDAEQGRFVLAAPRRSLERFQRELPAGSVLKNVPVAGVDGLTVTAELSGEISESDLRVFFEQQGFPDAEIIAAERPAKAYRLELSYEPIRQKMQEIFGNLAARSRKVSFERLDEPAEGERVRLRMTLGTSMLFADVRQYFAAAALGDWAEEAIEGRDQYAGDMRVTELTLSLPRDRAAEGQALLERTFADPRPVQKIVRIGSTVAEEMQGRALLAVVCASIIIVLYVAVRFHAFRFGVAAVIALVHDILITAGLIALADWSGALGDVKIGLATLAAFLTILGYSLNDTIVVFDRIRENMAKLGRKRVSAELIDLSINQTLSRTILTSVTTLAVVAVLYWLGGSVLKGLALTLIIGVVVGTYSSMFIASPILLDWAGVTVGTRTFFRILLLPIRLPFKAVGYLLGGGR